MSELLPIIPAAGATSFLGFATDPASRHMLQMAAGARGWVGAEVREGGIEAAGDHVAALGSPGLLVVDITESKAPLHAVDALANVCTGDTRVIAIGTQNDVALYRGLRTLGVADYVVKPLDEKALAVAIDLALGAGALPRVEPGAQARADVIAFLGARGGSGTTAIAIACAHLLASTHQRRVIFVDLDLQAGSSGLDLDVDASPGLAELVSAPDRIDTALVEAAMRRHPLGFRMLSAEEPLDRPIRVPPDAVQALLAAVSFSADAIVVDMPRRLDRAGRALLRTAERVVIVSPMSLVGMRDSQRLSGFITGVRAGQRPMVVANRIGETRAEVGRADFEKAIGGPAVAYLPYRPQIAALAAERATALSAMQRRSDLQQGLERLAAAISGTAAPAAGRKDWKALWRRIAGPRS
jgi:pilus assembly protein CpaE